MEWFTWMNSTVNSRPDALARLHGDELGGLCKAVLLQLELDEARGEAGAVDGHVHLLEHIGDGPHVVLVAVGDEEAPNPGPVFDEIGHVGDDGVNAVHVVPGKAMPQSTTMISPPNSKTVMFLPISLSPPKGMIFNFSAMNEIPSFQKVWKPPIPGPVTRAKRAQKTQASVACTAPFRCQEVRSRQEKPMGASVSISTAAARAAAKHKENERGALPRRRPGALVHAPPPRPPAAGHMAAIIHWYCSL